MLSCVTSIDIWRVTGKRWS